MRYEVIREIKNSCSGNQMRDVHFSTVETTDPEVWIRSVEPKAGSIRREDLRDGIRFYVTTAGQVTEYSLTEDE